MANGGLNLIKAWDWQLDLADSPFLNMSQEQIEDINKYGHPEYGALPYFSKMDEFMQVMSTEIEYFNHGEIDIIKSLEPICRKNRLEGLLLFMCKTGMPLSQLVEVIVAKYSPRNSRGKTVSIYGLPGSGKTAMAEVLRNRQGVVVMDNDTVRYNLFAWILLNAAANEESMKSGRPLNHEQVNKLAEEFASHSMTHNRITDVLYLTVQKTMEILKDRGYVAVCCSVIPYGLADEKYYLEHPDSIIPDEHTDSVTKSMWAEFIFRHNVSLSNGKNDNYNWQKAIFEPDIETMDRVVVAPPLHVIPRQINNMISLNKIYRHQNVKNPRTSQGELNKRFNELADKIVGS